MIEIHINNQRATPAAATNIKLTRENPYLSERGDYTYQITFPLDVAENRRIFGNINRTDATLRPHSFEHVTIRSNGRTIIDGRGTLLSLTEKEARLQIVAGKSAARFTSKAENVYIDEIDYGTCSDHIEIFRYDISPNHWSHYVRIPFDYDKNRFIGKYNQYTFFPTYDVTHNIIRNINANHVFRKRVDFLASQITPIYDRNLYYGSPQPYLLYIIACACEAIGYNLTTRNLANHPIAQAIVANATASIELRHALPHWTTSHFFRQVEMLFALTFQFDERSHTAAILPVVDALTDEAVRPTTLDTFSAEIATDPLSTPLTDNLAYRFDDDEDNRTADETLPDNIFDLYALEEVADGGNTPQTDDLQPYIQEWTRPRLEQTIFHLADGYYYIVHFDDRNVPNIIRVGAFMPLIRNNSESADGSAANSTANLSGGKGELNNENSYELQIIPALLLNDCEAEVMEKETSAAIKVKLTHPIPVLAARTDDRDISPRSTQIKRENNQGQRIRRQSIAIDTTAADYTSTFDYLFRDADRETDTTETTTQEENTGTIALVFLSPSLYNTYNDQPETPDGTPSEDTKKDNNACRLPFAYTDSQNQQELLPNTTPYTLALPYLQAVAQTLTSKEATLPSVANTQTATQNNSTANKSASANLSSTLLGGNASKRYNKTNSPAKISGGQGALNTLTPQKTRTTHTITIVSPTPPAVDAMYIIRHRRYLCLKAETTITPTGINPTHTLTLIQL